MESLLAASGYANAAKSTASPKGVEYQVFAKVTRELSQADTGDKGAFPKLADALHQNLRLWTVIAADVAHKNNKLPADLRSKLFYLSEFTRQHSRKVLNGDASPDVLVDINMSIMKGLRQSSQQGETP